MRTWSPCAEDSDGTGEASSSDVVLPTDPVLARTLVLADVYDSGIE